MIKTSAPTPPPPVDVLLKTVIDAVENLKAQDVVELDVRGKSSVCDFMVVTSGKGGVGKTTSSAALGAALAQGGEKVAVVAVDPSSNRTGGSVLGDRTRMASLTSHENAFVRPSPSGNHLGGVARDDGRRGKPRLSRPGRDMETEDPA